MTRRRVSIAVVAIVLVLAMTLTLVIANVEPANVPAKVPAEVTAEVAVDADAMSQDSVSFASGEEKDFINTVIKFIRGAGGSIAKAYVPGGFGNSLADMLFDLVGFKTMGSDKEAFDYVGALNNIDDDMQKINDKLNAILERLSALSSEKIFVDMMNDLNDLNNHLSRPYDFLNSKYLQPLASARKVLNDENSTAADKAKARENIANLEIKCNEYYDILHKDIEKFGLSSGISGPLGYLLQNVMGRIVKDKVSHKSFFEHYYYAYKHLWAYDTQIVDPMKDIITYTSTVLNKGLVLFLFTNECEVKTYLEQGDKDRADFTMMLWSVLGDPHNIDNRISIDKLSPSDTSISAYMTRVYDIFAKEIAKMDKIEADSKADGCMYHYASGKRVSKDLYVGRVMSGTSSDSSNLFVYKNYTETRNPRGRSRNFDRYFQEIQVYTLKNNDFYDSLYKEFETYKIGMNKGKDYTLRQYLIDVGFNIGNADVQNVYKGMSTKSASRGQSFSIEVYDSSCNAKTYKWGDVHSNGSFKAWTRDAIEEGSELLVMAFKDKDGKLMGSYENLLTLKDTGPDKGATLNVPSNIDAFLDKFPKYDASTSGKVVK